MATLGATASTATFPATAADVPFVPAGTIAATNVQAAIEEAAAEASGSGAPADAQYLVAASHAGLSAEVVATAAGLALLDDADATAQRTTLGLGTLATQSGTFSGTSSGTNTGDQTIPVGGTPAVVLAAAAAAGSSPNFLRRDDTIAAFDATVPVTQDYSDAAATGAAAVAARRDHVHGMPAAGGATYATPAIVLGTAAAAGAAGTGIRSDSTIVAFDATTPAAVGTAAVGAAAVASRRDHVHATGAGTPSTQAFGDAAATGSGPAAAMTDHKHAMPAATQTLAIFLTAFDSAGDSGTSSTSGTAPNRTAVMNLADAATQGCYWTFMVPADWASGVLTITPVWVPSATDATPHTVAWSMVTKDLTTGIAVDAAGTTIAWTGASAARTVRVMVYDTATSTTVTPAAAGDLIMFNLRRVGADAADSYVGIVQLLGVIVSYTANR